MRIPTTEARRTLDTGAGSMSAPRLIDAVGPGLRSLGGAISQLAERYQRQQDADEAMRARKSFLDFQTAVQEDYRASLEEMPESGAGHFDRWFVGTEEEPPRFQQHVDAFIATVPAFLQDEYGARAAKVGADLDNTAAFDQLAARRSFANSVITQQMDVSVAAISQNPGTFEDQLEDVQALVVESGLPVTEAAELLQASEQQLAMIAARAAMERDREAFSQALDGHANRSGARRIDAASDAAMGDEARSGEPSDPPDSDSPTATRRTIGSRVEGAFEAAEQGVEPPTPGSAYEPILRRLEPSQIDDLRFELEDVRFEEKRRADYDAAALRRGMAENLKAIRETGRAVRDIDPRDVKSLLGEEEAKTFESDRTVARTIYRAAEATAGLPEEEAREVAGSVFRRSGADPNRAEDGMLQVWEIRRGQLRQREMDPALSVQFHPEVEEARALVDFNDPETVSAYLTASLNAQAADGIDEAEQSPTPRSWVRALARNMDDYLVRAERSGFEREDALQVSLGVVRGLIGDRYAGDVMLSAIGQITGSTQYMPLASNLISEFESGGRAFHSGMLVEEYEQTPPPPFHERRNPAGRSLGGASIAFDFAVRGAFQNARYALGPPVPMENGAAGDRIDRRDRDRDVPAPGVQAVADGLQDVGDGFANLGTSISRGTTGLVVDGLRGAATIPNQIHRFRQNSILNRIRNAGDLREHQRTMVRRRIDDLRYMYPDAHGPALVAFEAILDGRLRPEDLTREMVFRDLPSLEESALMGWADSLEEIAETYMPVRPGWEEHYTTYIGEFLGRDGPAILLALNGPYRAARLAMGVSAEILVARGEIARSAMEAGASDEAVLDAMNYATLAGFVNAAPIDALIEYAVAREIMWEVSRNIAEDIADSGALDVTQGVSSQVLENLAVRLAYDEEQGRLDGALEAGIASYADFLASQILEGATVVRTQRPTVTGSESDDNSTADTREEGSGRRSEPFDSTDGNAVLERRPLEITVTPADRR